MGMFRFQLPPGLSAEQTQALEHACLAGSYDGIPVPTRAYVVDDQLSLARDLAESSYLMVPWPVEGAGQLMAASATLMHREPPYQFLLELARGKLNQLRNQAVEWRGIGLQPPPDVEEKLRSATQAFCTAVTTEPQTDSHAPAQTALQRSFDTADALTLTYVEQLLSSRLNREGQLATQLACQVGTLPDANLGEMLKSACTQVIVPLTWKQMEPTESQYRWDLADGVYDWAGRNGLAVAAGPLIDFSAAGLPDWLSLWENDPASLTSFMCDYVETAVGRYRGRIRRWQLTAASNSAEVLGIGEDELLRLTLRLAEAALQVDPQLELLVGIAQPWGEYLRDENHTYSPFVFADTLLRAGLNLAAVDVELFMGYTPRGSYCRDLIETYRLLDFFAKLGVPVQVSMGYASASGSDAKSAGLAVDAGSWRDGYTPRAQADWAGGMVALALSQPYVSGIVWAHANDADPHLLPNAGLIAANGAVKPVLARLRQLRQTFLK